MNKKSKKQKTHPLKIVRLTLGSIFTLLLTALFLDFADILPRELHFIAHFQLIPAFLVALGDTFLPLLIILVLTLLFGRIYCSVICPLGVFQDFISWLSRRLSGLFSKKGAKNRHKYEKPLTILRYFFLLLMILSISIGGMSFIVSILDPYADFGRIITHLFRPLLLKINNLFALFFEYTGDYYLTIQEVGIISLISFIISAISFVVVGFLSFTSGRKFCNAVCPVGTILGLLSKISLFKVRIDESKCSSCGLCEMVCKSRCISSKLQIIDSDRCVDCFNCLGKCPKGAIRFSKSGSKVEKSSDKLGKITQELEKSSGLERRRFVIGISSLAIGSFFVPKVAISSDKLGNNSANLEKNSDKELKILPIVPPGAVSIENLNRKCVSCHLCINHCPEKILKPARTEYGLKGIMQPLIDYTHGFCEFDCKRCSEVCPTGAIRAFDTIKDKQSVQIGVAHYKKTNCQVNTMEISCGICAENCPTKAITMVKSDKNDLLVPQIDESKCIGCGACEYFCPTASNSKSISVIGNKIHKLIGG